MVPLILGGSFISLVGLAGLINCIFKVMNAKKSALNEDELKAVVRNILPMNLASLFLSVLGLMAVVIGILLG
ncbi:hypothetical protein N9E48_10660 [Paracoccaceae bacterium]|jgi:hypothetical protein|nr:hypothetical protein [Paracoccaceae bacterium]